MVTKNITMTMRCFDFVLHLMQYNHLTYDHPAITTLLLGDLVLEKKFDIALSLSRQERTIPKTCIK